jgi:hypothetical protein
MQRMVSTNQELVRLNLRVSQWNIPWRTGQDKRELGRHPQVRCSHVLVIAEQHLSDDQVLHYNSASVIGTFSDH